MKLRNITYTLNIRSSKISHESYNGFLYKYFVRLLLWNMWRIMEEKSTFLKKMKLVRPYRLIFKLDELSFNGCRVTHIVYNRYHFEKFKYWCKLWNSIYIFFFRIEKIFWSRFWLFLFINFIFITCIYKKAQFRTNVESS